MKILFLIKKNNSYGSYSEQTSKSGLLNSAKFLLQGLLQNKIIKHGKIAMCDDGNDVDREVHEYKPNICIIEALWVTPDKLAENIALHPTTLFIVRIHSCIPFLAMEGIAMEWIQQYPVVSFNNEQTVDYINTIITDPLYLPNIDEKHEVEIENNDHKKHINIGCFGSVRPLKNQLLQAVAAINYGNHNDKDIHFHINATRIEQKGDPVLKNIRSLFADSRHKLIEHGWLEHGQFIDLIRHMDIGLQTSYTESFNIVSADFVHARVPIIVSPQISWQVQSLQVDPNDAYAIENKIHAVLERRKHFIEEQLYALKKYNKRAVKQWKLFVTT